MTKILIPSETSSGERRVSATPEAVKKLKTLGCDVYIESSAGKLSGFSDLSYEESGGTIINNLDQKIWGEADLIFCVQTPSENNLTKLKKGAVLLGLLNPYGNKELLRIINSNKISALSLELLPFSLPLLIVFQKKISDAVILENNNLKILSRVESYLKVIDY